MEFTMFHSILKKTAEFSTRCSNGPKEFGTGMLFGPLRFGPLRFVHVL